MAGPDRIEWRRGFPSRALRLVGSCAAAGGVAVAIAWLLFGDEPDRLSDGGANPLAPLPQWTLVVAFAVTAAAGMPLVRRPMVTATHYALTVRPGVFRTLLMPWASIAEVVGVSADGDQYLLVRLRPGLEALGDRPTKWDQAVLREAQRAYPRAVDYQLAVRLCEFAGPSGSKLATLAAYAPETVYIADRI